jgi:hypothetical protein
MSATRWLRISSIVSLLFTIGHTLGGSQDWSPIGQSEVLSSMRTYRFDIQGVNRSYIDFYRGFGFDLSVLLLLQAVVLWQLATIAKTEPLKVRSIVASFVLASLLVGIITWSFLFPTPVIFSAVVTACLVLAYFAAGGRHSES